MPWGQYVQTGDHSRTKFYSDPNAKKIVEASGSVEINGWNLTYYYNESGKFEVKARRLIKKRDSNVLVNNTLELKLETSANIPKIISIEREKYESNGSKYETFIEINDGLDSIVKEFNEYQDRYQPYSRKYARSSIIKAYDFLKQYLPEFEDLVKDENVEKLANKIVKKAEKL